MLRLAPRGSAGAGPTGPDACFAGRAARARAGSRCLAGCVTPVIGPSVNEAAIRVLTRHGIEVVMPTGQGCCGGLVHHMGREREALAAARANVDAWTAEIDGQGLDAILITASGCGTTVKDYGFMLRTDPAYAAKAARVSRLARDICEYLARLEFVPQAQPHGLTVAYHAACSLQHGQKIVRAAERIAFQARLRGQRCAGRTFVLRLGRDLQHSSAGHRERLRERKVANIEKVEPDVIAAGNIGCITQIAAGTAIPVVHTVELIDWATGGPEPEGLKGSGYPRAG